MAGDHAEELMERGYGARRDHRVAEAKALFAEAVGHCREANDSAVLARALTGLGQIERDLQETSAALGHYEEAVAICRTLDDQLLLAHTVRHVGNILRNQGNLALAATCYSEALAIYRGHEQTPPLDLANALRGFALLKVATGDKAEARDLWQEAGRLYAEVDVRAGVAESEKQVALLTAV
jgi:tetratricopeptide (TPR) repeat protein